MNLANEVSTMQSELESLRAENHVLKQTHNLLDFENDQLRKALAKSNAERDHHMVKKGELKALLDSAGSLLVSGVRKYHDGIIAEQEAAMDVDTQAGELLFLKPAAE
jgi:regulator of replication initiation timing